MANLHLVTGYAGTPHITAEDHGSLNAAIFGSGSYVLDRGNKLSASAITSNQVRVLDGDLLIQGRHARLAENTYVDLTIENGAQGYYRNDLIVARYTKNSSTGVEQCNLVVIKGTAATADPADPAYTEGDILGNGDATADFPLYRIPLDGLTVGTPVPLFSVAYVAFLGPDGKVPSECLPEMNYIPVSQKGAAGGVAPLGSDGKVGSSYLPSMNYIPLSQKGAANGVAALNASGKFPGENVSTDWKAATNLNVSVETGVEVTANRVLYKQIGSLVFVSAHIDVYAPVMESHHAVVRFSGLPATAMIDSVPVQAGYADVTAGSDKITITIADNVSGNFNLVINYFYFTNS